MDNELVLLDTPKKISLQQQSKDIRGILKAFERKFTAENGRKPSQADIKIENDIAGRYREYNRIQDVLAGKLSFERYNSTETTTRAKTSRHARMDSGVGSSPQKQSHIIYATPKKHRSSYKGATSEEGPDLPGSSLMNMVGPTPHRDGKVLGLFDLMSASESTKDAVATPSTSTRKRKIEDLYEDTPAKRFPLQIIQSPSHGSRRKQGDLLEFLAGTPQKKLDLATKRHSRTPQSEGRKFELSQFFATPSAQRFLFTNPETALDRQLSSVVPRAGATPQRQLDTTGLDATPSYLRRSTSFKDRLMSAGRAPNGSDPLPSMKQTGPPTLRHFRSSTSNIFRAQDTQQPKQVSNADDHDDDLEALRDLEDGDHDSHVLVEDSQLNLESLQESDMEDDRPVKQYKKKGQKRTTRKANIKPVVQKATSQPKFVAADGRESNEDAEGADSDPDFAKTYDFEGADGAKQSKAGSKARAKRKAGTINPNAQSHQNFRSLKIKGKATSNKAGGKARFAGKRR